MLDNDKQQPEKSSDSSKFSDPDSPVGHEWQLTVDTVPDVILILDKSFRIARCNKAALEYFGLPREQIEGRLCWEVTHSSNEPHAQCPVIAMQRSRKRERAVIQMNGGHFEITADPILDGDGEIQGVVHLISDVSERIDAVRELKEANLLYQDIIDNQSAGIYRIRCLRSGNWADVENPPYKYEFLNDRYSEITGFSREELMADVSATMKLVHPDDLESWIFLNQKADSTLEIFKWEGRFIVNGQIKWIHFESRPRVLSSGDRVWTGVLLDITELKTIQDKLLKTESVLSKISTNLQGSMIYRVVRKPDGIPQFTYLGGSVERFYGVSADEVISDPGLIYGRVHPDEVERLHSIQEEAYRKLSALKAVVRMINPDGSIRWSSFMSTPTVLPDGSTSWDGIETDITDLKRAEDALRDSEEKFRTIFENSKDGIFLLSMGDFSFNMANASAIELFGLKSASDIIGRKPWEFSPERQPDGSLSMDKGMEMADKTMRDGIAFFEWTHRKLNGELLYSTILLSKIAIGGKPAILATVRDITLQKKAEEERLILEENLRHAEKMQAVGHLAGGIAHDFNNQLMGIMGYAEMIFHKSADPEVKDFATSILSASRRGSDLTRKLLAFSRKGKYHAVPVDLHEMILEVVKILEHSIDRKIKITHDLRAGKSVVSGDPTQIQNALLNLAINSRDAMPQGGELSFETENLNLDEVPKLHKRHRTVKGPCIRICVRDNGHGMDEDTMKHIFEPFFSTKPAEKGSGMGLASVYGTVKSHKGYVYAESEPGKGSCFDIFLPVADAPVSVDNSKCREEAGENKSLRILLADDDEVVRKMLSRMLGNFGHKVVIARDGAEAVEVYKSSFHEIDLVVLDMVMPRMNGKEAFYEMQKINGGIKALMISGFSIDGEVQQLLKSGMKGFLQKPFEVSVLRKKITEVLAP